MDWNTLSKEERSSFFHTHRIHCNNLSDWEELGDTTQFALCRHGIINTPRLSKEEFVSKYIFDKWKHTFATLAES